MFQNPLFYYFLRFNCIFSLLSPWNVLQFSRVLNLSVILIENNIQWVKSYRIITRLITLLVKKNEWKRKFKHIVDTEDASETDNGGRHEEPLEIKEQMYQDKLAGLKKKLQQLKDGTHHEYNKKVRKLEYQYRERKRLNSIYREYMISCVERDYILEKKAAAKEFEEKKIDLKENLLSDFEDKRKVRSVF